MNKLLLAVTDNQPRVLLKPVLTSILEGISKILPAGLIFGVFMAVYAIFSQPDAPVSPLRLWLIWGMLCILAVVQYLASYWAYNQCFVTAYENSATGRLALAERLRQLPLGFFAKRSEGELTTTLLDDFAMLEVAVSHFIPQFVGGITIPVIAFLFFLFIEWEMALAMFIALPLFIAVIIASRRMFARLADRHGRNKAAVSAKLQEYLDGIREIKAHNLGGDQFESLEKAFATQRDESIRSETLQSSVIMLIIAIFNIGLPVMIFTGVFLMARGELLLPVFLLFLLLGSRIFDTISIIMTNFVGIRIALSSARRIAAIRNELPLPGTLQAPETGYDIIFDRVSFSYGPQTPVLTEISLAIPAKKMTALVGPSGCGKTTITRLIARFWDVDHGQIRIGNIPVNEMAPQQVLGMLSVVFQDVYLFHDTIENNIRVGKMNATQEEIEEAARKACCHDFIMQLPGGYQTLVGEGGCTLSGGEKQRISIARALIKDAPIILLDEATASLDADNEVQVQKGINALVRDKTVVIIAHQLKTVQNAHQIIVLNEGAIVEQGRHKDLLGQNGLYAHLWELQQRTADWQLR